MSGFHISISFVLQCTHTLTRLYYLQSNNSNNKIDQTFSSQLILVVQRYTILTEYPNFCPFFCISPTFFRLKATKYTFYASFETSFCDGLAVLSCDASRRMRQRRHQAFSLILLSSNNVLLIRRNLQNATF